MAGRVGFLQNRNGFWDQLQNRNGFTKVVKNLHHELDSIKSEGVSTARDAKITQSPLPPPFRAVLIFRCFYWSTVAPTAVLGVPELSQISDVLGELFCKCPLSRQRHARCILQ